MATTPISLIYFKFIGIHDEQYQNANRENYLQVATIAAHILKKKRSFCPMNMTLQNYIPLNYNDAEYRKNKALVANKRIP